MAHQLRRFADQTVFGYAANVHHVVRDQLMSALDQLQRRFAFADAGIAGDQKSRSVNVHQNAVARFTRGEVIAQIVDHLEFELRRFLFGGINRHLMRRCQHQHIVEARVTAADHDARHRIAEILRQTFAARGFVQLRHVRHFDFAQQLRALIGEKVPVVCELQTRAIDVADLDRQHLRIRFQNAL